MTTSACDWRAWLSDIRIGSSSERETAGESEVVPVRSEFHRDYDRIIFSSAFRRLSDKTQVVPFPQSDYTRRRLTHSLEVSCVGRSLATEIFGCRELGLQSLLPQGDFEAIVATACLAHDIGNPPFGHFGERAIQDWAVRFFSEAGGPSSGIDELSPGQKEDLIRFEGNAQSFRVLTRLQMASRRGGMRLTAATLGALIKYPRPSLVTGPSAWRKHGCFQDDWSLFQQVFQVTGGQLNAAGEFSRHPLAWLSEAADDICYVIVDLEDGCRGGLITLKEATGILNAIGQPQRHSDHLPEEDQLAMGRALAINQLVRQCAAAYRSHITEILQGSFRGSLMDGCPASDAWRQARSLVSERVFNSLRVLELEAAGYRAIQGLLDMLVPAILAREPNRFQQHLRKLTRIRVDDTMSTYQKILACTDNVSGMTDRYCVEQYRKLSGL